MRPPADAIVAVTHRCNAHCVMCNIWKSRAVDALQPEHMRKLPAQLKTINLSGGEPFLRPDLAEFVREAHARCPRAIITISTNALLADRIVQQMDEIMRIDPAVRLAVSLDGIGPEHDRIRGTPGIFDSAVKLIDGLLQSEFAGLRLSMTLSQTNLSQFLRLAEFADRCNLELGVVAAHNCQTHLGIDDLAAPSPDEQFREDFGGALGRWLRSWRPKQWLRAHFAYNTYRLLTGRPWNIRCHAGKDFFFLQADGTVFSCSVQGRPLGNIIAQEWPEIWHSPAAEQARQSAGHCPQLCWMICNARSAYRRNPLAVAAWILLRKPLAHGRLLRLPALRRPSGLTIEEQPLANTPH